MVTIVGASFFTKENVVITKMIRFVVETLVVKFDQHGHEKFLSYGLSSSKPIMRYHQVTTENDEVLSHGNINTRVHRRYSIK